MSKIIFGLVAFFIIVFDQLTKLWVTTNLSFNESIWETGFFRITIVHNTGAAFGIFQGSTLPLIVIRFIGAIAILVVVFLYGKRVQALGGLLAMIALGLLFGGTVGNLIDSLRLGYVVDFLDFNYWPTFNIADSSVVVSMIIIAYLLIRTATHENKKAD